MAFDCIIYNLDIILTNVRVNMINGSVYQIPNYVQTDNFYNLSDNPYFKIDGARALEISGIEWQWRKKIWNSTLKKNTVTVSINDTHISLFENVDLLLIMMFLQDGIPDLFMYSKKKSLKLIDNCPTQSNYYYRYVTIFADKKNVFDYIEETLFDGTHDKLHDGGLMRYHQAGKPKKLRVQWHIKKSEYTAYFWFEDERIRKVFDKFYGAHPDTKTDFIIRIDAEERKYELALYRYGLKEPQIIPKDVYQLLVFKNKFEDYRSENYNQERGAWIW